MDTENRAGRGTKNETRRNEKNGTAGRETGEEEEEEERR